VEQLPPIACAFAGGVFPICALLVESLPSTSGRLRSRRARRSASALRDKSARTRSAQSGARRPSTRRRVARLSPAAMTACLRSIRRSRGKSARGHWGTSKCWPCPKKRIGTQSGETPALRFHLGCPPRHSDQRKLSVIAGTTIPEKHEQADRPKHDHGQSPRLVRMPMLVVSRVVACW